MPDVRLVEGAIDDCLHRVWRNLRNDCGPAAAGYARGLIDGLSTGGLLNHEQRELWTRRFMTCPGHDDEGGRSWCAYCGDMPDRPVVDGPWRLNDEAGAARRPSDAPSGREGGEAR